MVGNKYPTHLEIIHLSFPDYKAVHDHDSKYVPGLEKLMHDQMVNGFPAFISMLYILLVSSISVLLRNDDEHWLLVIIIHQLLVHLRLEQLIGGLCLNFESLGSKYRPARTGSLMVCVWYEKKRI